MTHFSIEILKDLKKRDVEASIKGSIEIQDVGIIESIFHPRSEDEHHNQGVTKRAEPRTPKVAAVSSSKGKYTLTV